MKDLFAAVDAFATEKLGWCTPEKSAALAAITFALRPSVAVEIGVWQGASCIPILMAMKETGIGRAIAIDPWAASASVLDENPANVEWWGSTVGQDGHDKAHRTFIEQLEKHGLSRTCDVWRRRSDEVDPPACQLLHVDGSHTEQAVRDVERFGARVDVGGIMVLDDIGWSSGGPARGMERARTMGFVELYAVDGGQCAIMQRRSVTP